MRLRRVQRSLSCWIAGLAVLLGSFMPLLVAAAAGLQGRPVAEICTVYGVALPAAPRHEHTGPIAPADAAGPQSGHHPDYHADHHPHGEPAVPDGHAGHGAAGHAGTHCALMAMAAFAAPDHRPPTVAAPPCTEGITLPPAFVQRLPPAHLQAQPRGPPMV